MNTENSLKSLKKPKRFFGKTRKSVRIDETKNSVRTLSDETKKINKELSREVKNEIFNRRNNEYNKDTSPPEHGVDEIYPRLTKNEIKEHRRETLKKVSENCNTPRSSCTISGGKRYKNRKSKKSKK
jgi:hypothetical protein